eukprot:1060825-Pyramimonas_sp.AAC.3
MDATGNVWMVRARVGRYGRVMDATGLNKDAIGKQCGRYRHPRGGYRPRQGCDWCEFTRSLGIFSRRTSQTQEAQVYSYVGPIRRDWHCVDAAVRKVGRARHKRAASANNGGEN